VQGRGELSFATKRARRTTKVALHYAEAKASEKGEKKRAHQFVKL